MGEPNPETTYTKTEEKQNSITLKKDSKGNYNWDLKVYFGEDYKKALLVLKDLDNHLKENY